MSRLFTIALVLAVGLLALAGCGAPTQAETSGDLTITLAVEPATPLAGKEAALAITVARGGQPVSAARVLVVRRMIGMEHPGDDIVFESAEQGDGRYSTATSFAMGGRWDVQVIVTPPTSEARTATFTIEVEQP